MLPAPHTMALRPEERDHLSLIRHCEERSDAAIQSAGARAAGLLRFARNDESVSTSI
jgi:hypothetical protein